MADGISLVKVNRSLNFPPEVVSARHAAQKLAAGLQLYFERGMRYRAMMLRHRPRKNSATKGTSLGQGKSRAIV
jgi:hypothetical protein